MSKAHRGSGIREEFNHGRGTCPVCKRTQVKILFEATVDGEKAKVCKACNANIKAKAAK